MNFPQINELRAYDRDIARVVSELALSDEQTTAVGQVIDWLLNRLREADPEQHQILVAVEAVDRRLDEAWLMYICVNESELRLASGSPRRFRGNDGGTGEVIVVPRPLMSVGGRRNSYGNPKPIQWRLIDDDDERDLLRDGAEVLDLDEDEYIT